MWIIGGLRSYEVMRGQLPTLGNGGTECVGDSKVEGDFSRAKWEEKGVVRMLRMRSL